MTRKFSTSVTSTIVMLTAILTTTLASTGFTATGLAAPALRQSVVVEGANIHLGDLLTETGEAGDIVIGTAPQPGKSKAISLASLAISASRHGVTWQPTEYGRVTVKRSGNLIPAVDIENLVLGRLEEEELIEDRSEIEIKLNGRSKTLYLSVTDNSRIELHNLQYDADAGRFSALLYSLAGEVVASEVEISGRTFAVTQVPVLARRLQTGATIGRQDIEWTAVRSAKIAQNIVMEQGNLVGKALRRAIKPGKPVRSSDLTDPVVVSKGAAVTISLNVPNMKLSVVGIALEDGADGQTIKVANSISRKVVYAQVMGPSDVSVAIPGQLQKLVSASR